jgi:hypothetical protein
LSCGGDECYADSLSLSYNHTYQHPYLCVCVRIYLFVVLSIPCSWLSNSLFLLDTGILLWNTTSCRPCQTAFLPGFHRCSKCACCLWLSNEMLCLRESVDFLSFLDMYWPVFSVLLVCLCVFVSRCAPADKQTQ